MIGPWILDGLKLLLRALALPFSLLGLACAWIAYPLIEAAGWLAERARQWRVRLYARGGHTDLGHPPRS